MKRMVLSLFLPFSLASIACDRDDDDPDASEEVRAGDQAAAPTGFGKHSPVDKLCALVSCSDEQRAEIAALVPAKQKPERDHAKRDAANAALASAFKSDSFSAAALADYRTATHDGDKRPKPTAQMIVGIHGVLEASQRDTLADMLEARGPGALFGKGGKHGDKKHGDKDKAGRGKKGDRSERFAAELCERIDCKDGQATAIAAALTKAKPSHERNADADTAFAEAFRADKLDAGTVTTYLAVLDSAHEREATQRDAAVVAIHGLLDAEQRGVLADEIAEHGLRALMPERRHHGGHGKDRPEPKAQQPA